MPARIPGSYFARNLVTSKSLLFQLVKRDFQQRYVGSAAGWVWSIIHPLVLWLSYVFIFQTMGMNPIPNYALVLFVGMLPWFLFSETVMRASNSDFHRPRRADHENHVPVRDPSCLDFSLLAGQSPCRHDDRGRGGVRGSRATRGPALLLLPVWAFIAAFFSIGVSWIAAGLQVYLRDTAQVVTVIMTFWFWLTPIFLPEDKYAKWGGWILRWNPMAYFVRAYRFMLLGKAADPWRDITAAAAFALVAFVCGGLFFRQMKKGFADVR